MTAFEKVSFEFVKFMRGQYKLDEVAGMYYDIPCLRFRQGKKTIFSVNIHMDYYDVQIVLGKTERGKFDAMRQEFPEAIQELYDRQPILHDGKWLLIRVDCLEMLEVVKKLILIKKQPNRKKSSKERVVLGKCGHRCDMCVHYTEISEEFRNMLIPHLDAVYGMGSDWSMRCTGCDTKGCHCCSTGCDLCVPLKCIHEKQFESCFECEEYPCEQATVGYRGLEHKSISADDVTWAILPYVPNQYEQ